MKRDKNSTRRGQMLIAGIIALLIIGSVLLGGGFRMSIPQTAPEPSTTPIPGSLLVTTTPGGERSNLQLETISFVTTTPAPNPTLPPATNTCIHAADVELSLDQQGNPVCKCTEFLIKCLNKKCISVKAGESIVDLTQTMCADGQPFSTLCGTTDGSLTGFCMAKPVIYLYPTAKTIIDVSVETPGEIVVSDPLYPPGGWKNVEAHPDGTLFYQGGEYRELFYETNVNDFLKPSAGIVIASSKLKAELATILFKIGLNAFESNEFMNFWIPRIKDLDSDYILFSIIDKGAKEAVDRVVIKPEPDTRIEFIAYFKPIDVLEAVKPLILPDQPARKGFTMVEWGGVIDNN